MYPLRLSPDLSFADIGNTRGNSYIESFKIIF